MTGCVQRPKMDSVKRIRKKKASKRKAARKSTPGGGPAVNDKALREELVKQLEEGRAHADWRNALADMPYELQGVRPEGAPHTAWQLLEHMRIAQWDILEFSRDAKHQSPQFPDGYWPKTEAPPNAEEWGKSVRTFGRDLEAMTKLASDPQTNLFERIAHGDGQTILCEALLAADHNAYHLGQLILLRKMLGAWSES